MIMQATALLPPLLALALAPLLLGVINRTKALFAGRRGQPLLQTYFDIWKLLHKGAVYSRTTTWVFRAGPVVGLACALAATALTPLGGATALLRFPGDLFLLVYLLAVMRFFTVIAALDTGSSFEGMGASREVWFSALAEPALLLALVAVARPTGSLSLSRVLAGLTSDQWLHAGIGFGLVVVALLIVLLAENSRIPVDDPNTHLELTMIHEVMVLDHSGPDFAFILYGAALKLWVLGAVLVGVMLPVHTGSAWLDMLVAMAGLLGLAVIVGVVESSMARLRLVRVPQLLVGASALAVLALILAMR
jgi:formate hydrogenlyase subunit 4